VNGGSDLDYRCAAALYQRCAYALDTGPGATLPGGYVHLQNFRTTTTGPNGALTAWRWNTPWVSLSEAELVVHPEIGAC
jgi:hypothetical protein